MVKNLFVERRELKKETNRRKNDGNKKRCSTISCSNFAPLNIDTCKKCRPKCTECEAWKRSIRDYSGSGERAPRHCIESDYKCDQRISDYVKDYRDTCYICRDKCVECYRTKKGIIWLNKLGYFKCRDCIEACVECKKYYMMNNCHCYSESLR